MDTNTYMPVAPVSGGMGDGFGNGWWIILLFLFAGGFGNGFGGFGGNGAGFVGADVQRGFDQSAVMGGVSNLQNGITAGFGDLQTSLCGGFAGVNAAINNGFAQAEIGENARQMANMQQMFALQTQVTQTQNIVQSEGSATRAAILEQTNAILDKLCQQEIEQLRSANVSLQNQLNMANLNASQVAQTAQIISALAPTAA
ncbi:MAG: hypothetical protein J6Y20_10255 [Lachnospiraceae bacterium]|nr:hypothetical protein [Lachnospiraceae bacterium]MBP5462496.1 hypothetical protein [Lachnospiraceae bacterium]